MRRVDAATIALAPLWQEVHAAPEPESLPHGADLIAAKQQAEHADALERGYQDGYARGVADAEDGARKQALEWQQTRQRELDAARAQYEQAGQHLESLAAQIPVQLRAEEARAEALAIEIAYAAVVRMLGVGYADRSIMQALVRQAMQDVEGDVDRVLVSSADALALENVDGITVTQDPQLAAGQCRLESRMGTYDTGLDVRLELLRQALLAGLAEHRAEQGQA
ncbi:MAG TPA: hypothetical protein DEO93_06830 [Stenotrophomonas sp.]|nr:hypothetical protein [Stenotrophomonas sp.]